MHSRNFSDDNICPTLNILIWVLQGQSCDCRFDLELAQTTQLDFDTVNNANFVHVGLAKPANQKTRPRPRPMKNDVIFIFSSSTRALTPFPPPLYFLPYTHTHTHLAMPLSETTVILSFVSL
ncbi:hypothetical protein PoB_004848400 [Plakobranchus ocellatus]|uniref:Uncharacterized protein n=1 Tax=Plakobranchus ocellatus TaxID=259542 RepID=A0AAV4BPE2_9GAST|nr:hypothetical protein PoB_004848400 [Plakobranchus ocellatus]